MNHMPGEKLEEDRSKMLATLISATRNYILFVLCRASRLWVWNSCWETEENVIQKIWKKLSCLVGNKCFSYFLKHFPNYEKTWHGSSKSKRIPWYTSSRTKVHGSSTTGSIEEVKSFKAANYELGPDSISALTSTLAGVETMDLSNNRFDPSLLDGIKHKVKLNLVGCRAWKLRKG